MSSATANVDKPKAPTDLDRRIAGEDALSRILAEEVGLSPVQLMLVSDGMRRAGVEVRQQG